MTTTKYKYVQISENTTSVSLMDSYNPALEKSPRINEIVITKDFVPPTVLLNNCNIKCMFVVDILDLKNNTNYKSKIALFQSINFIDSIRAINYIWNEYFLMCNILAIIPKKTKYINIPFCRNGIHKWYLRDPFINVKNYTINFPSTIMVIKITVNYKNDDIIDILKLFDNLPIFLEQIIISVPADQTEGYDDFIKREHFIEKLIKYIKLPFGCTMVIDKFYF